MSWSLPGYDVRELLGYGGTGEVWRAVEQATGEVVALKRLRPDADPSAVDALRREAAVLRTLDTPHVVRLRAVVGDVLVLDHAAGGSLAALLQRRGSLQPGEVVTVVAPLAGALAAAHARGLVHGDVTPANVLFTGDGMPLLSDLGLARLAAGRPHPVEGTAEYLAPEVAAGGAPSAASDVWSLAAVAHHALAGSPPHEGGSVGDVLAAAADGGRAPLGLLAPSVPRPVVEAVEAALSHDPARRPDAAAFAAILRTAHAAAPVALRGPAAAAPLPGVRETHAVPRHAAATAPARRRLPRWALPAAAAVLLLAVAAGLGWWSGRSAEPETAAMLPAAAATPTPATPTPAARSTAATPPAASPTPGATDWRAVLDVLDAARADAFATGDAARLADASAPGSPALAADTALVQQLVAAGQTASGVRHEVRSVEVLEETAGSARLRVADVLAGYDVRGSDGAVVRRVPPRGEAAYLLELTRTPDGWRLARVTPA